MNFTGQNVFVLYLVMVGLPFLGVLAVLELGSSVEAPVRVAGEWQIDGELESNLDTPCAPLLSRFYAPVISISQSGKFLEIALPNRSRDRLLGSFADDRLLAEARPALFGDDVFDLVRISGRLAEEEGKLIIHGVLAMPRRIDCIPVPFRAQRTETGAGGRERD